MRSESCLNCCHADHCGYASYNNTCGSYLSQSEVNADEAERKRTWKELQEYREAFREYADLNCDF